MSGTIMPSEAKQRKPDFFAKRPEDVNWTLKVKTEDGKELEFVGVDWKASSKFGSVENVVAIGLDDQPIFDRPVYSEAPNVNVVAWGRDTRTGEVRIAIITEQRPHANHPTQPDSTIPLNFAQIPMGFLEKIIGKTELSKLEFGKAAAMREVEEETGASVVRGVSQPACPWQNPSPSFVASWSGIYFIEVDLDRIGEMKKEKTEPIYKAEYLLIKELLARIREGQNLSIPEAPIFRACTSLSALMIFFSCNPEIWPR